MKNIDSAYKDHNTKGMLSVKAIEYQEMHVVYKPNYDYIRCLATRDY